MADSDQHFLLFFIMGTFFGPDLIAENPKKPALQRMYERLPSYTFEDLANTTMKLLLAEKVYYHVLRKASKTLVLTLPHVRKFFRGELAISTPTLDPSFDNRQFPDLFPTHLHACYQFGDRYRALENVVFINNPDISYMKPEDVERFKRLTGLKEFELDEALVQSTRVGAEINKRRSRRKFSPNGESSSQGTSLHNRRLTFEEWMRYVSLRRNGVIHRGVIKRPFRVVHLQSHDDAYHFRIPLPPEAKNMNEDDVTCLLKENGRVFLEFSKKKFGGRAAQPESDLNEVQEPLYSKGGFTVTFRLPGPIKVQELNAKFNGHIFEASILKDIIHIN